jgi:hypothetical protein
VKLIIVYLVGFGALLTALVSLAALQMSPGWLAPLAVVVNCAALGGIGGCVYCLRGVYLNACVHKRWDETWYPWYFIRPLVSVACGGISFIFLQAGLLVLGSSKASGSTDVGFYALAFIAGLNVDKFVARIEGIAQAVWGIERSRTTANSASDERP